MTRSDRQKIAALTILLWVFILTNGIVGLLGIIAIFLFWSYHLYKVLKRTEKKNFWHYLFYGVAIIVNLTIVGLNIEYLLMN